MFTFFISTTLWVYIEPILSLHLIKEFQIKDYMTPLFFLVFSSGYLLASLVLFKMNKISGMNPKKQVVIAFIMAGVA